MSEVEFTVRSLLANKVVAWLIFGLLAWWALRWQYMLLRNDFSRLTDYLRYPTYQVHNAIPPRVRTTVTVCLLIGLGVIAEAFITFQAGLVSSFPFAVVFAQWVLLLPLFCVVSIKSFFGPIFTVGALAFAVFYYINFNQLMLPPVLESVFDFAASLLPESWERFYVAGFTIYAVATSWHDSFA